MMERGGALWRLGVSYVQRRGQKQLSEAGRPTSIKEYDEQKYGGWKSAEILFSKPAHATVIGRWDWHVVQFLLALIPPSMVLLLVQWARHDMQRVAAKRAEEEHFKDSKKMVAVMEEQQQQKQQQGEGQKVAAAGTAGSALAAGGQPAGAPTADGEQNVQQRLNRLELLIQELVAGQHQQRSEQQAATCSHPSADHDQATGSQQQQQRPQQEAGLVEPRSRWAWLRRAPPEGQQQQQQVEPGGAHVTDAAVQSSGRGDGGPPVGTAAASQQREGEGRPQRHEQHQGSGAAPQAATGTTPSRPESSLTPNAAADTHTAGKLLHAMGWPLRWLRRQSSDHSPPG